VTAAPSIKQRVVLKENRSYLEKDSEGNFRTTVIEKKDSGAYKRDTMKFPILGKLPRKGKRWQIGKEEASRLENKGRFFFDGEKIKLKIYDFEDKNTFSAQPNLLLEHGDTASAAKLVNEELLGYSEVFDNPKPLELLIHLLKISMNSDDLVVDFFAGSGTTAHAVMQLNAEDGGNRRCISVQIDESTDEKSEAYKAGYKTIFDITKTRIEKASAKIKEDNPEYQGDLGFKIFETKPLSDEYLKAVSSLEDVQSSSTFIASEDVDDLLTTWKVYDGIPLTTSLEEVDIKGYRAHLHATTLYLMNKGFESSHLACLLKALDNTSEEDLNLNIEKIVVCGVHFNSKNQREISEGLRQYQNRKEKDVDVEVRY